MSEVVKVVIVEALIAKLAIEALDVSVLRRLAGSNQLEIDTARVGPSIQRPARKFRPLVGANSLWQATKLPDRLQDPRYVAA